MTIFDLFNAKFLVLKIGFECKINPKFNDDREMVIRKTDFISDRTFAIRADKAAGDLSRDFIENITNNKQKFRVILD